MSSRLFTRGAFVVLSLLLPTISRATTLKISPNATARAASEVEANYSTTHLYIDEVAGDQIPLTVFFDPQTTGVAAAEVFTNLNRRDRAGVDANGDGIEDGIKPPDGNLLVAGDDTQYFKAYAMTGVTGGYQITLYANKTGAYRLTARYRLTTENNQSPGPWHYYNNDGGHRDHCFVVSPKSARDLIIYEVNPLTVNAEGTLPGQRGTFAELANGLGAGHAPRFSLDYAKSLGVNTLWFQPIHPNGIAGRQTDPGTGSPFEVGSPYAVKNFFEVMPLMARGFTPGGTPATNDTPAGRAAAMSEFQSFAAAADAAGVKIMLDAPFNHTAYDGELAALGQTYFGNAGTNANTEFRNAEARFFSRTDRYDQRASGSSNIALAPDRYDFGKFADTYEVYYGRYASLVTDPGNQNNYKNEQDWFDYSIGNEGSFGDGNGHFDAITQNAWRYFASYTLHWLDKTGYPANPMGFSLNSDVGVDCLRADFGQGLPPQCWEYIINRTRTRKWNFIFMAESLDGGEVTYRSARHFDILNENIVFPLHGATNTNAYRGIYDGRRNAYGQALVLLNSSSHDEDHYNDPYEAAIRFAVNSSVDGAPLIFPGQELGLSGTVVPPNDTNSSGSGFGYDRYEVNFGKPIPHFKKFNSLVPLWNKTDPANGSYNFGLAQLYNVYSAVGQARRFSSALRSSNRYYLNQTDNFVQSKIFSVAKYSVANAAPGVSDVVLAFVNLDRNNPQAGNFNVNVAQNGSNLFGIKSGRIYNVKNISAYLGNFMGADQTRRDVFLFPNGGRSGADLLANGLYIALNRVPTLDTGWGSAPYEAQYLKLYDVTPPPTVAAPANVTAKAYVLGNSVTFTWPAVSDPDGGISGYRLTVTDANNNVVFNGNVAGNVTSYTLTGQPFGRTLTARVTAINNAGVESAAASPPSAAVVVLDPAADQDGDGVSNASEDAAGTNLFDANSNLRVLSTARLANNAGVRVTWTSVPGKTYVVQATTDLQNTPFTDLSSPVAADANLTQTAYTDPSAPAGAPRKFYRVRVVPGP